MALIRDLWKVWKARGIGFSISIPFGNENNPINTLWKWLNRQSD